MVRLHALSPRLIPQRIRVDFYFYFDNMKLMHIDHRTHAYFGDSV